VGASHCCQADRSGVLGFRCCSSMTKAALLQPPLVVKARISFCPSFAEHIRQCVATTSNDFWADPQDTNTECHGRRFGKANDVLHEGSKRQYVFVVLGHRRSAARQDRLRMHTSSIHIQRIGSSSPSLEYLSASNYYRSAMRE
jgi:hypothetical protein